MICRLIRHSLHMSPECEYITCFFHYTGGKKSLNKCNPTMTQPEEQWCHSFWWRHWQISGWPCGGQHRCRRASRSLTCSSGWWHIWRPRSCPWGSAVGCPSSSGSAVPYRWSLNGGVGREENRGKSKAAEMGPGSRESTGFNKTGIWFQWRKTLADRDRTHSHKPIIPTHNLRRAHTHTGARTRWLCEPPTAAAGESQMLTSLPDSVLPVWTWASSPESSRCPPPLNTIYSQAIEVSLPLSWGRRGSKPDSGQRLAVV